MKSAYWSGVFPHLSAHLALECGNQIYKLEVEEKRISLQGIKAKKSYYLGDHSQ